MQSSSSSKSEWTQEQDDALRLAVMEHKGKNWKQIAAQVPGHKTNIQCLQRYSKVLKPGLVKGPWTTDEDELLKREIAMQPPGASWASIARAIPGRAAKQCRERWTLVLDPGIRKEEWTEEEDAKLLELYDTMGSAWVAISRKLVGRTENSVKSRFRSIERKRSKHWTPEQDEALLRTVREGLLSLDEIGKVMTPVRSKHAIRTRLQELSMEHHLRPNLKHLFQTPPPPQHDLEITTTTTTTTTTTRTSLRRVPSPAPLPPSFTTTAPELTPMPPPPPPPAMHSENLLDASFFALPDLLPQWKQ